jgi:dephospho-CoA kinase
MSAREADRPLRLGLTGGIGSGKSTVATMLAARGACVIDSDAIARSLTLPGGAAIDALRLAFGAHFIDATGALDRERMRTLAFSDPLAKQRLECILHPMIAERTLAQTLLAPGATLVYDVPLLVESGRWRERVDRILVVDCREVVQVERVMQRSGWDRAAVEAVLNRQASRAQRRAVADDLIFNDGIHLDELAAQVDWLWNRLHR